MTALNISAKGVSLIHSFESCAKRLPDGRFQAYKDPGSKDGKPHTIGWGSTGPDINLSTIWTQAQCDARFNKDIVRYVNDVNKALAGAATSQEQFDALVSFHYNTGAIGSATLTTLHKAGRFDDAEEQFGRWVKNDGKTMAGLVRRREAERSLYDSAIPSCVKQPMPAVIEDIRVVNAQSGLNVRASGSATAVKLGSLVRGTSVKILEDTGDWVRFNYNGKMGWVNDQFLTAA